jgi:hypothetical protein
VDDLFGVVVYKRHSEVSTAGCGLLSRRIGSDKDAAGSLDARHGYTIPQHVQARQLEQRLVEAIVPYDALRRAIGRFIEASIDIYLLWPYRCSRLLLA